MAGPASGHSPTVTGRAPPPKPVVKPWVTVPKLPDAATATLPPDVTAAWRGFWHALGSNLPWYINHSRATRRALRAFAKTHG